MKKIFITGFLISVLITHQEVSAQQKNQPRAHLNKEYFSLTKNHAALQLKFNRQPLIVKNCNKQKKQLDITFNNISINKKQLSVIRKNLHQLKRWLFIEQATFSSHKTPTLTLVFNKKSVVKNIREKNPSSPHLPTDFSIQYKQIDKSNYCVIDLITPDKPILEITLQLPPATKKFELAFNRVIKHEGGYNNDKFDLGKETKYGISKRFYEHLDIKKLTIENAKEIYKRDYWDRYGYGAIKDIKVAIKVFDLAVNVGGLSAHTIVKQALRSVGRTVPEKKTSVLTKHTLQAINTTEPDLFLAAIRSEAAGHYRNLIIKNPSQEKFLNGWLNRAYR